MIKYMNTIFLLILISAGLSQIHAQRFGAALIAGPSISQVEGDNLAGYDYLSYTAGLKAITYINSRWNVNIELLYNKKGSRDGIFPDDDFPRLGMDLDYVEVPLYIEVKDWEVESEEGGTYSKVSAHAGLSYGRLISSDLIELPNLMLDLDELKENDLSYLIGLRFQWNPHWGFSARYSRSFTSVGTVEEQVSGINKELIPYSISFRLEYIL